MREHAHEPGPVKLMSNRKFLSYIPDDSTICMDPVLYEFTDKAIGYDEEATEPPGIARTKAQRGEKNRKNRSRKPSKRNRKRS